MAQYAFFFDATRCTGCKTCEFACKDYKDLTTEFAFRKVYEVAGGETTRDENGCIQTTCFSYSVSSSCQHCDNPACVANCPTGAMTGDLSTRKHAVIDQSACVGCTLCARQCKFDAISGALKEKHSIDPQKCVGCGLCAAKCPKKAITLQ